MLAVETSFGDIIRVMDEHKRSLLHLCRICGNRIQTPLEDIKQCYDKRNFHEEIFKLYKVDVDNEDKNVFPRFVCQKHANLLYKYRRSLQDSTTFPQSVIALKDFLPHREDCLICSEKFPEVQRKPMGRPAKRKKTSIEEPRIPVPATVLMEVDCECYFN